MLQLLLKEESDKVAFISLFLIITKIISGHRVRVKIHLLYQFWIQVVLEHDNETQLKRHLACFRQK